MKIKLTPQEIISQQFTLKSKGFDRDEVTGFLNQVAEILENEILERERLKMELEKSKMALAKFEKREDILKDTLIAAQKFSKEIKINAGKESELMLKEAEVRSTEIINHTMLRQRELKEEIRNLKFKRREIESHIFSMIESLKELIASYHKDDEDFDRPEHPGHTPDH